MRQRINSLKCAILFVLLCGLSACAGLPDGIEAVNGFELPRYLGKWYEIARLDHSFERGLSKITADYSMREDGGVKVLNRGFNMEDNAWDEAEGKAYFVGDTNTGALKVSFFGPFYGGYNIIDLDKDGYQYALVAGPNLSYLWILARTPDLDDATLNYLLAKADAFGFAIDDLIFVEH
ncbi:MAG: lipocalin [Gammaproteobacteria bacterium]|nr:lipocalin [Gammaproteobacteria bacterium]